MVVLLLRLDQVMPRVGLSGAQTAEGRLVALDDLVVVRGGGFAAHAVAIVGLERVLLGGVFREKALEGRGVTPLVPAVFFQALGEICHLGGSPAPVLNLLLLSRFEVSDHCNDGVELPLHTLEARRVYLRHARIDVVQLIFYCGKARGGIAEVVELAKEALRLAEPCQLLRKLVLLRLLGTQGGFIGLNGSFYRRKSALPGSAAEIPAETRFLLGAHDGAVAVLQRSIGNASLLAKQLGEIGTDDVRQKMEGDASGVRIGGRHQFRQRTGPNILLVDNGKIWQDDAGHIRFLCVVDLESAPVAVAGHQQGEAPVAEPALNKLLVILVRDLEELGQDLRFNALSVKGRSELLDRIRVANQAILELLPLTVALRKAFLELPDSELGPRAFHACIRDLGSDGLHLRRGITGLPAEDLRNAPTNGLGPIGTLLLHGALLQKIIPIATQALINLAGFVGRQGDVKLVTLRLETVLLIGALLKRKRKALNGGLFGVEGRRSFGCRASLLLHKQTKSQILLPLDLSEHLKERVALVPNPLQQENPLFHCSRLAFGGPVVEKVLFHGSDIDGALLENVVADEVMDRCKRREAYRPDQCGEVGVEVAAASVDAEEVCEPIVVVGLGRTDAAAASLQAVAELTGPDKVVFLIHRDVVESGIGEKPGMLAAIAIAEGLDHDPRAGAAALRGELQDHVGEAISPKVIKSVGADLGAGVALEGASRALVRCGGVEANALYLSHQAVLHCIYDRALSAAVVAGKK